MNVAFLHDLQPNRLITLSASAVLIQLAKHFLRGNADRIEEVLQSLVITGNARRLRGGKYVAS